MTHSIDEARRGVERSWSGVLAFAESEQRVSLWEFETKLWFLMLALGRALVGLFLARQAARPSAIEYQHDGQRYERAEVRTSEVGTRFGKVSFRRAVGRVVGRARTAADLPLDRTLGLCNGFSLGVVTALGKLCAQMAYAAARAQFKDTYDWTPSPRATLRMVDALGAEARGFVEQAPAPDEDGEILVIQVDGKGAPMISARELGRRCRPHEVTAGNTQRHSRRHRRRRHGPKIRRTKGKKSKNAKVAVVGVLYTLKRTEKGLEGPIGKRVMATFDTHEALFQWLHREALKRGYPHKEAVFLADGLEHIWRLQERYFPQAVPCVDWYHVVEKLWAAGEVLYRECSDELREWVADQSERLRRSAVRAIRAELARQLLALPKTGPGNKGKRERLAAALRYLETHRHRLRYAELRKRDIDIGTGVVEGAVRNLVGLRLDGPGMRWSRDRAECVLHLRCILINGQWPAFENYIATLGEHFTLAPKPVPAEPYAAAA
jgi:hypothetical protein